ncbi:hypothetical protein SDC9_63761 [bioreactor metagenome]|uniref:Uncharacterized protein n=1 Tax=bioreactor metagenome TaxID=1076179 RepID=A0A644XMG4_9ZZZZ
MFGACLKAPFVCCIELIYTKSFRISRYGSIVADGVGFCAVLSRINGRPVSGADHECSFLIIAFVPDTDVNC